MEPSSLLSSSLTPLERVLVESILADHPRVPDTLCRTYQVRTGNPITDQSHACVLPRGHDGVHLCSQGFTLHGPYAVYDTHPGTCGRCKRRWPCSTIKRVYKLISAPEPERELCTAD